MLESKGWHVQDARTVSSNLDVYRDYITQSRAEFTVAKDQNVQLRSGWFSDRSATYLAAGRPVITQETGFSNNLPTGEGLFGFTTLDEIVDGVQRINSDYERHSRAASEIAREYFSHGMVLTQLLARVGVELAHPTTHTVRQERMVEPRELVAAGGSPLSKNGDQMIRGKLRTGYSPPQRRLTKSNRVKMCAASILPDICAMRVAGELLGAAMSARSVCWTFPSPSMTFPPCPQIVLKTQP
jgi:hypothetical protein